MNPFQVIWAPATWKRLHRIRRRSANPTDVDHARARIEQALGIDPHGSGIPLSEGLWKLSEPPLQVFFSINTPRQLVRISDVGEII